MKHLYLDLETIPSQLPGIREELAQGLEPPGNISKAETIAAWHAEKKPALIEAAYRGTSFDGGAGQVCVIGFAFDDQPAQSLSVDDLLRESEAQMIENFFTVLQRAGAVKIIGHNIIGFDLPFLWKRCMVLDIKPPWTLPRNPKPWADNIADTMLLWDGNQRSGASMERICRLMGIPGKGDMDGSNVWPAVQEGRIDDVAEYCRGDIERTRAMYKRMTFA